MKKTAIVLVLLIAACTTTTNVANSGLTQTDADRAATKFPGTTLAELNKGKKLYEDNCGRCHGLKEPKELSEDAWRTITPPMARKADLDSKSEDLVLRYVVTMCGK